MSHVDEGTIHAWLDGAFEPGDPEGAEIETHLASCEACRRFVEAERSLRDRAAFVLGQAAPDAVRVEPFESMIAGRRAAAAAGPAVTHGSEPVATSTKRIAFRFPLAAAATVALAVTATLVARRYMPQPNLQPRIGTEADAVGSTPASPVAQPPAVMSEAPAQKALADRAISAREVESQAASSADQRNREDTAGVRARAAAPPPPVVASTETTARSSRETRRLDSLARGQALALDEIVVTGMAAPGDAFAYRMMNEVPTGWSVITAGEAASRLGRATVTVENLAIDSVHATTIDDRTVIRITQTIDGTPVHVFEWIPTPPTQVAGRDEAARRPAPAELRQSDAVAMQTVFVSRIPGLSVMLRAALPQDSLAALGTRIR